MGYKRLTPTNTVKVGLTLGVTAFLLTGGPITSGWFGRSMLITPAMAEWQSDSSRKTVDLDIVNGDLVTVVGAIQRQTGADIVVQDDNKPYGRVTVHLSGKSIESALRRIALSANAEVTLTNDGVYLIKHPDPNASANLISTKVEHKEVRKLILQHAIPNEILSILHWDQGVRPLPASRNSADNDNRNSTIPSVVIMNGQSGQYLQDMVPSVPNGKSDVGSRAANRYSDQANRSIDNSNNTDQAQQFPGGGFPGGGFQGGGGFPGGFGGGDVNNPGGPGFGGVGAPGAGGRGGLPEGVDQVLALQGDNSLLIYATPEGYQRVRDIVKNLDIAPRQVQIKMEFVTVSVNDLKGFGVQYSIIPFPGVKAQSSLDNPGTTNTISIATGNLVAQMEAALTRKRGKVVQAPIITTTNNVVGSIFYSHQVPYQQTTTVIPNNGQAVTNATTTFQNISNGFGVAPRINSDDTITLSTTLNVQTPTGNATPGSAVAVDSQQLTFTRTVKNGETMVIGGLVQKTDSVQQNKIPILSDVPIIGPMFRSSAVTHDDVETLVFVTVNIIDNDTGVPVAEAAGSVTP